MRVALALALALPLFGCSGDSVGHTIEFTLNVEYWDFGPDRTPVPGADVCVDEPSGGDCGTSDADEVAVLDVPTDQNVLLRISHPTIFPALAPIYVSSDDEGRSDVVDPYSTNLVAAVAATLGMSVDPTKGHLTFAADPGDSTHAGRMVTLLDPDTEEPVSDANVFYLDEANLPDPMADTTVGSGSGGFANAPPGEYFVDSVFDEHCRIARGWKEEKADGTVTMRAPIRAGHITLTIWADCINTEFP